ncbi:gamma-glutamyltransferase family protein [Catenovulum sp. SX2]|uniref:gamma-glutamyltransferase family protein n=1 Tax=Catenovulum sp. SX2 TaxID=3398614 RepID=UPI003F879AB2
MKSKVKNIAFTAPHWAATEAGMEILELGGTAVEAMVAAAAVISVVYPHMNSLGGDGFWLIDDPLAGQPIGIDACGKSAGNLAAISSDTSIAQRGGKSVLTQAATVRGWALALKQDKSAKLPLSRILARAIDWANKGFSVTESLQAAALKLSQVPERNQSFKNLYEADGRLLQLGQSFKNPQLADAFTLMAKHGLDCFYQGELAECIVKSLQAAGSPLTLKDMQHTQATLVNPLSVELKIARLFNLPAPTQGVHSLQILAVVEQLQEQLHSELDWLHAIVEASKQSFNFRDKIWADPSELAQIYQQALSNQLINQMAQNIALHQAQSWPFVCEPGDTVWMGATDAQGQMVSFIQSIYWEFGSGVAISDAGFVWNNRGCSFNLDPQHINCLQPNKKPAHTLNPALAKFADGRRMVYGSMGGEGQPQTQAAIFSRYAWRGCNLADAISQPRWLLGRTWGEQSSNLKIEQPLAAQLADGLSERKHDWQAVSENNEMMGHAGAIVAFADQAAVLAATDPRSDGLALSKQV